MWIAKHCPSFLRSEGGQPGRILRCHVKDSRPEIPDELAVYRQLEISIANAMFNAAIVDLIYKRK
jgi:hypothetical protein